MFNFFKKKAQPEKANTPPPQLADINQFPLQEGDLVEALRYDLGKCKLTRTEKGYVYESLATGEQVSWLRMVDAITQLQKVKKITEKE
jgi:hypothetical protein